MSSRVSSRCSQSIFASTLPQRLVRIRLNQLCIRFFTHTLYFLILEILR